VVEQEYGAPFDEVMDASIITPHSLANTFLLKDSSQLVGRSFAKRYTFEGETKPGFVDYGFHQPQELPLPSGISRSLAKS